MSSVGKRGKKRPKSYYLKCANQKRSKRNRLEIGMKGFIVTCNSHEDQAVKECYNLLNEYAEKLYGPEQFAGEKRTEPNVTEDSSDNSEEDIEKALEKEVTAMKDTKPHERRFQRVDSSAKNCLFIKANIEDPSKLGHMVLTDIAQTQVLKSRYALRLIPIQMTCKAFTEDILKCAEALLEPHFRVSFGSKVTFSVLFKTRNNNSVSRNMIVPKIGELIKDMNPLNSCDYHNPDRVVMVEVICKIACIGVLSDFYKLRKYNLHEVAAPKAQELKEDDENLPTDLQKTNEGDTTLDPPVEHNAVCKSNLIDSQSDSTLPEKETDFEDNRSKSTLQENTTDIENNSSESLFQQNKSNLIHENEADLLNNQSSVAENQTGSCDDQSESL